MFLSVPVWGNNKLCSLLLYGLLLPGSSWAYGLRTCLGLQQAWLAGDPGGQSPSPKLFHLGSVCCGEAGWGIRMLQVGSSWQAALALKNPCALASQLSLHTRAGAQEKPPQPGRTYIYMSYSE